jgi:uncharacterized repeat protein (TIGR01451 family)
MFGTTDDVAYPPQQTAADGTYGFADLPPGEYRVTVDETTLPPFARFPTTANPSDVTIAPAVDETLSFGFAAPDLAITKTTFGLAMVGAQVVFDIVVDSVGPLPVGGPVVVTDPLPAELSFVGASGSTWSCAAAGQLVTCTSPGPLAPGASLNIRLVARVEDVSSRIVNTVEVHADGDVNASNDSSAAILPPPAPAPALSAAGIAAAWLGLAAVALIALRRRREPQTSDLRSREQRRKSRQS